MRRLWVLGALVSSLVLAACGSTASIDQAVTSIGASANLQVRVTLSASGAGTASAQPYLKALSLVMDYSSVDASALSASAGHVNSQVSIDYQGQSLLDVRVVGTDIFLRADLSALASIPGTNIPAADLAAAQLLLGGRWFEVSESLISSYLPTTTISAAQANREVADARAVIDALSALIERTPYKTLSGGGYSQTGTLGSVEKALLPVISQITATPVPTPLTKGTYTLRFTMSGSTATGGSVSITAPSSGGNATVGVHAAITHDSTAVVAPVGATVITRALLTQLLTQVTSVTRSTSTF